MKVKEMAGNVADDLEEITQLKPTCPASQLHGLMQ